MVFPNLRLFVITCLDPRVDPAHFLGLQLSDAMVVRNVGGRVTQEVINDVAYIAQIAENVLEKYLSGLREQRKDVFAGVKLQKDGTLDGATLERNLNKFPEEERRPRLVDGLNELLYAELLAVKRTLGAEHEATLIQALRDQSE